MSFRYFGIYPVHVLRTPSEFLISSLSVPTPRVGPIVLQTIAMLLRFCNTYYNTFEILQYLLQFCWDFAMLIAILLRFCNTWCNTLRYFNTCCNPLRFCNTCCNTFIFCDIHYITLIHYVTLTLCSIYSNILIRSNNENIIITN